MSAFTDLRKKLAELFQLDAAAELDFGIYRILNARRVEIEGFLDSLGPQVEAILTTALQSGASDLKAELEKVEAGLRAGGIDEAMIATAPKVRELRDKLAAEGGDPELLAREIFSLLTTFFSRYYKDGDFISLRRYKKDTYAIPYEGEEVKLHWANADQYYIKSAETFRDYTFRLGPAPKDDKPDQRPAVSFKLVEADIEKDNNKAAPGQERRFVFTGTADLQSAASFENLILHFTYAPVGKKEKQGDLNTTAAEAILAAHARGPFTALAANDPTYTVKNKTRSVLAKHLTEYTGKNSFDYFIHKDLGGFLRRELDFFIKNEVLHLDDLDEAPESNWKETRAKFKALRSIAGKIIRFLAQIEDFQKKLWLKKKFVVGCDYVITLDRIPEELYPELAACDAQREEWVKLFAIDEIKGDLGRTGYSVPLTVEFLRERPTLAVDTRNLSGDLSQRVIQVSGSESNIAFNSDNFHALRLSRQRIHKSVSAIYIDPPYNTLDGDFSYKDNFERSSWMTMINERIHEAIPSLARSGQFICHIDEHEYYRLEELLKSILPQGGYLGPIIWDKRNPKGDAYGLSAQHEYIAWGSADPSWIFENKKNLQRNKKNATRILEKATVLIRRDGGITDQSRKDFRQWISSNDFSGGEAAYCHIDNNGDVYRPVSMAWPNKKRAPAEYFEPLIHPVTRMACPVPERGWRNPPKTMKNLLERGLILFGPDETTQPNRKYLLRENMTENVPSLLYFGGSDDDLFTSMALEFTNPKPVGVASYLVEIPTRTGQGVVLDFFAGSGTTGHAVINLNREDGGDRKFILIEMGEHFDTVLVPRLKKVIYSKDWKDGKPQSRNTGISHCFKILRLESYEDTLNNLRLHRSREQELALESFSPEAREDYQLGYMLDLEASGSQSLLNVSAFTDPFGYQLHVASGTAGETRPVSVDLVETFNWLLGLTVLAQGQGGGVTWVEGTNPDGEKVLVLWRNTAETDAEALNAWCRKQKVSVLDGEFALIYLNGDHFLENLRREDQTWKVRLIDEEFPKLMWEGCE